MRTTFAAIAAAMIAGTAASAGPEREAVAVVEFSGASSVTSEVIRVDGQGGRRAQILVELEHADGRPFTVRDGACFITGSYQLAGFPFTHAAEVEPESGQWRLRVVGGDRPGERREGQYATFRCVHVASGQD